MDSLKNTYLLLLLCICCANAQQDAASAAALTGTLTAYVNTNVLVSGETLYYKVYCRSGNNSAGQLSRIAYAELVGQDRKPVFTQKLFLADGTSSGEFFIPPSLASGTYKLFVYTKWMASRPVQQLFQLDVLIVNPFFSAPGATDDAMPAASRKTDTGKASLELTRNQASSRSRMGVRIAIPESYEGGEFSLSVRKTDGLTRLLQPETAGATLSYAAKTDGLTEIRGESVSGSVANADGSVAAHATVALSFPGKEFELRIAESDENGRFYFTIENPVYQSHAIVQVTGEDREGKSIVLDPPVRPDYSALHFRTIPLPESLKKTIEQHSVASQVENAYFRHRADTLVGSPRKDAFYHGMGRTFVLDDYTRFRTFAETIVEVVEETYFEQKQGRYFLHVREHIDNVELTLPPLVIVDGIYLQDVSELFSYPAKNIYSITTIAGPYYYGPSLFDGVISVKTTGGDYTPKAKGSFLVSPELLRPVAPKRYFQPDYSRDENARIPDYRVQLAWLPRLSLKQPVTEVEFYTSDIPGQYQATLEGIAPNGDKVRSSAVFTVE